MPTLSIAPSAVEEALRQHIHPVVRRLGLEETPQAVTLTGTVPNFYLKQLAQEAVLPLLSGRELFNRVEVARE